MQLAESGGRVRLIAATSNGAKVAELRRVVGDDAIVVSSPHDISLEIPPEAGTGSVEAIASAKAVAWSHRLPGEAVIASDGGLLIPALGESWNPVLTRRFAATARDDVERARALLARCAELKGADRRIGWREAIAIARDGDVLAWWAAESPEGLLATTVDEALVRAGGGFWVPSLWHCLEFGGRLLAQLTADERAARIDHWSMLREPVRHWLRESKGTGDDA